MRAYVGLLEGKSVSDLGYVRKRSVSDQHSNLR